MYPSIYYLVADLFGIKIEALKVVKTYGFFVAIAFLAASYVLSLEMKRKEKQGLIFPFIEKVWKGKRASVTDLVTSFIIAFLVGYKLIFLVLNLHGFINDTQGYLLSLKGNLPGGILSGIVYAYLRYREIEKHKLPEPKLESVSMMPHTLVGNITLIAAGAGLLGAKVFDTFDYFGTFLQHPFQTLFSFSGLTVYGGIIFGAAAVLYYTHKKGIPILQMIDAAAAPLMLAYGLGRIGCQMAGDGDWGIANPAPKPHWMGFLPDWVWAYNYPHNIVNEGVRISTCMGNHCYALSPPAYPAPFYETVMCVTLFFVLWAIRKKINAPGVMFSIYLAMNGAERFLIELIRVNVKYHFLGISATQAQIISPLFFVLGIAGILYFSRKHATAPA